MSRVYILISMMLCFSVAARADEMLVIVHPDNPVHDTGFSEMKAFILQNKNTWGDGQPIHYLLPPRSSKTFKVLIHYMLDMDETQWDAYWERQLTYGKSAPRTVPDDLVIIRNVTKDVNALGVIAEGSLEGEIRKKVKIIYRVKL